MTKEKWEMLTNGEKAWMLNQIISTMNNEEAYYDGWLYIWPDGESYEQCLEDFADEENYKDLERAFASRYSYEEYHEAGLFRSKGVPEEIIKAAYFWDAKLGLKPIQVLQLIEF